MELDDFKAAWTRLELRMDGAEALALDSWRECRLDRSRASLRRFGLAQLIELAVWIAMTAVAATFWIEHRHTPHLLATGLALHAYGIAAIWTAATRALLAARVHYSDSVLVMQRRVAQLRRFATVSTIVLILPWWCLWLLAVMAGAKLLLGIDLYAQAPSWILANLLFGVLAMAASGWLARRWAARPPKAAWARRVIDDIAGNNLRKAQRQLDEIVRFDS